MYFKMNNNENAAYQNLWNATKGDRILYHSLSK